MADDNEGISNRRNMVTWGGIIALVSVLPIVYATNMQYVEWHDERYAKRQEVLLIAEATQIREEVKETRIAQMENTNKLDFLVRAEAAKTVLAIKQEIALHKAANDNSILWSRELMNLEARLSRAEAYKECLIAEQANCDAERIW